MEISLPNFVKQWRVAILGTFMQIIVSVIVMLAIGYYMGWAFARSIILGFVIALSSSAVVIKLLEEKNLLESKMGKDVLSILLTQDIAIAPILILTAFLGGQTQSTYGVILQILGATIILAIFLYLYRRESIQFTWLNSLEEDHEMQVFMAIVFCAAGALLMGILGLSPALGAFVGGIVVHAAKETGWIHDNLHPFRIIFVAVFFISIGAQIDLIFLKDHLQIILILMLTVFIVNHLVNGAVLKVFGSPWKEAALGGALLAQIGEMSFLVCFTAYNSKIITEFGYNIGICLISLTLLFSPLWILMTERSLSRY
ncbi:MAG: cation:proton antiporter, partial [Saprospiraceae bacterium]|nr:cation:proton antiporter [Saprospiraceae bacterium]